MIEIINCEQGTEEWFKARAGIPTASKFATVQASGRGKSDSKTRRKYMLNLLGERLTGRIVEGYSNSHMDRGNEMEEAARMAYSFESGNSPELVGFVRNGRTGASPDALIDSDGLLEIKTKLPDIQLELLFSGEVPTEHTAQIQGQLWVCEREWCDFVSYWPGIKPFIKRVYRDEQYIRELAKAVGIFNVELDELEERYLAMP